MKQEGELGQNIFISYAMAMGIFLYCFFLHKGTTRQKDLGCVYLGKVKETRS